MRMMLLSLSLCLLSVFCAALLPPLLSSLYLHPPFSIKSRSISLSFAPYTFSSSLSLSNLLALTCLSPTLISFSPPLSLLLSTSLHSLLLTVFSVLSHHLALSLYLSSSPLALLSPHLYHCFSTLINPHVFKCTLQMNVTYGRKKLK